MKKEYLKPENCPMLETPKVNAMVWGHLKQYQRDLDLGLQKGQGHLMSLLYALLKVFTQLTDQADSEKYIYINYPHTCRGVFVVCESTVQFEQKGVVEAPSE